MKFKYLFTTLLSVFLLASCASLKVGGPYQKVVYKKIEKSDREYLYPGVETCSNLYTNGYFSVLEVYCANDRNGLYIYGENYQTKFDWYDIDFNMWALSEGCNEEDDCFYELLTDGNGIVKQFKYKYFINLSEGYYKVKVNDRSLKVIEKKIFD
jgi:hypothetical protein